MAASAAAAQQRCQPAMDACSAVCCVTRVDSLTAMGPKLRSLMEQFEQKGHFSSWKQATFQAAGPPLLEALAKAAGHVLALATPRPSTTSSTISSSSRHSSTSTTRSSAQGVTTLEWNAIEACSALLSCIASLMEPWTGVLTSRFDGGGEAGSGKRARDALARTDLLPQMAHSAAVMAAHVESDPRVAVSGGAAWVIYSPLLLVRNLLHTFSTIITHDMDEQGLSICDPSLLAVVPAMAALARAVLTSFPATRGSGSKELCWVETGEKAVLLGHHVAGHLHMQYCAAFMNDSEPERGCSTATAHMLARNEDIQVLLLAWLTVKVAHAHESTRGGTRESSAGDGMGIRPGRAEPCPAYHRHVLAALGMHGLSSSTGVFDTLAKSGYLPRKLARIGLWCAEHQFLQVEPGSVSGHQLQPPSLLHVGPVAPLSGRVGIPCGAHGAVLALLCEYLATIGPEGVQVSAALRMCRVVAADWASKLAGGVLSEQVEEAAVSGMQLGLTAVLGVGMPAAMGPAASKVMLPWAETPEPELMFVTSASASQWSAHLLTSFWGVLTSILQQPESAGPLAAALAEQPATAAASLEWLARSGPFDRRQFVVQPSDAELVRMARAVIAACAAGAGEPSAAAPASGAAAAAVRATKAFIKAEGDVACMLITWLKVLKPITQQQQQRPPSAAWRALAELASAAAALGRASARASKSKGADGSAIKRGPGLWAVVAAHALWWLGSQLQPVLASGSLVSAGGEDAAELLTAVLKRAAAAVDWLADALLRRGLTAPDGLLSTAGWQELTQVLPAQAAAATQCALQGLRQLLDGASVASVWAALEEQQQLSAADDAGPVTLPGLLRHLTQPAAAAIAALSTALVTQLPCALCCNNAACSVTQGLREREAANAKSTRCGRCRAARYCCPGCQQAAWAQHKQVCKALAAAGAKESSKA